MGCAYIDPNPISSLNNQGHNYFLSQNPYYLNSYAGFGEIYYNLTNDLKLTGGCAGRRIRNISPIFQAKCDHQATAMP